MNLSDKKIVVCGAGGFICGHSAAQLLGDGIDVIQCVDIKRLTFDTRYTRASSPTSLQDLKHFASRHARWG